MLFVTTYAAVKAIHVLAAVIWVGGAAMVQLYALRALASDDPVRLATFAKDTESLGLRTFTPASLVLVLAGGYLVHDAGWGWSTTWVLLGILVWIASFLVGIAFLGPESGRIGRLIEERGPEAGEVQARIKR